LPLKQAKSFRINQFIDLVLEMSRAMFTRFLWRGIAKLLRK